MLSATALSDAYASGIWDELQINDCITQSLLGFSLHSLTLKKDFLIIYFQVLLCLFLVPIRYDSTIQSSKATGACQLC